MKSNLSEKLRYIWNQMDGIEKYEFENQMEHNEELEEEIKFMKFLEQGIVGEIEQNSKAVELAMEHKKRMEKRESLNRIPLSKDFPRTKIIATLGSPEKGFYKNGIYNELGIEIPNPTLKTIIQTFFEKDVETIRVDMNEFKPEEFPLIKETIYQVEKEFERKYNLPKRVGLMVDLPGPKINFRNDFILPSNTLNICLSPKDQDFVSYEEYGKDGIIPTESTVNILISPDSTEMEKVIYNIFNDLKEKLNGSTDNNPILAYIGEKDCILKIEHVDLEKGLISSMILSHPNEAKLIKKETSFNIRSLDKSICALTSRDIEILHSVLEADYEGWPHSRPRMISHIALSFCQEREDPRALLFSIINWLLHQNKFIENVECQELLQYVSNDGRQRISYEEINGLKDSIVEVSNHLPLIISKIETKKGAQQIQEILDFSDGVMITSGAFGVEQDLPDYSKKITCIANRRGKAIVFAKPMLRSMQTSFECSSSEATDVFNTVLDGADAIMLSKETSNGMYPGHVIDTVKNIVLKAEEYQAEDDKGTRKLNKSFLKIRTELEQRVNNFLAQNRWQKLTQIYLGILKSPVQQYKFNQCDYRLLNLICGVKSDRLEKQYSTDNITHAACTMSTDENIQAIVCATTSGRTARMIARFKPKAWIIAHSYSEFVQRKLSIVRGVIVLETLKDAEKLKTVSQLMRKSKQLLIRNNISLPVIYTCGTPVGKVGSSNLIHRLDAFSIEAWEENNDEVDPIIGELLRDFIA